VGIIAYEFLVGTPPFCAEEGEDNPVDHIFYNICYGTMTVSEWKDGSLPFFYIIFVSLFAIHFLRSEFLFFSDLLF
jgi:hypothetical protein